MRLCRYWAAVEDTATDAKGQVLRLRKWGGSNESRDAALLEARQTLEQLKARVTQIDVRNPQDDYGYSLRDTPEELISTLQNDAGVTRNRGGCLVLNAKNAFFADIDIVPPGFFARLFGRRAKDENTYIEELRTWLSARPQFGARVYRTKKGLRYLFTHKPLPVNDEALYWLTELGSDRLYTRLCRSQQCYRARLSPKAFRIGVRVPEAQYPYETQAERESFDKWLPEYEGKAAGYAVCKLVCVIGAESIHKDLKEIVETHDKMTLCDSDLPLA